MHHNPLKSIWNMISQYALQEHMHCMEEGICFDWNLKLLPAVLCFVFNFRACGTWVWAYIKNLLLIFSWKIMLSVHSLFVLGTDGVSLTVTVTLSKPVVYDLLEFCIEHTNGGYHSSQSIKNVCEVRQV